MKKALQNYDQESAHKNVTITELKKEIEGLNAFNVTLSGETEELRNKEKEIKIEKSPTKERTDNMQDKLGKDLEEMLKLKETELNKMKEEFERSTKNDIYKTIDNLKEKHQNQILDLYEKLNKKDYT